MTFTANFQLVFDLSIGYGRRLDGNTSIVSGVPIGRSTVAFDIHASGTDTPMHLLIE